MKYLLVCPGWFFIRTPRGCIDSADIARTYTCDQRYYQQLRRCGKLTSNNEVKWRTLSTFLQEIVFEYGLFPRAGRGQRLIAQVPP